MGRHATADDRVKASLLEGVHEPLGSLSREPKIRRIMEHSLVLAELEALYSSLSPEKRDELLQCLLIAASISGKRSSRGSRRTR